MVFAGSAEPVTLDPFFASDGESFRVARQIFEGLVGTEPGTADPAPMLAKSWEVSEDGLTYDFTLEQGVKFQDGTDFDGEAVCANFDRWYNAPESAQSPDLTYYYGSLMRGFATGDNADAAVYKSCTAGDGTATVELAKPFAGFISALSLPAFSMQSPSALEEYQDDAAGDPTTTEYSTAHPTGTGPFTFDSWERGDRLTLKANPDYWGETASIDSLVFVAIDDPKARATALQNDEIDGFDLVGPADIASLEEEGFQVVDRAAFNVLYLGMNQAVKPLDDIKVRQAIAHAIDKQAVADASMPEGTQLATQFVPDLVNGFTPDVTEYEYDPEKAKSLLEEAGATGTTIEFNYPSDVSRPYMPQPEDTFNVIRSQLEAAGFTVKPTSDRWDPDYLNKIQGTKDHGIHLLGWTGDYNDADNFLGVFFGQKTPEWGFDNPELFSALDEARALPTVEEQTPAYQEINQQIMEFLPGVPLAHPVPSLAFAPGVEGYEPSPVQDEVFNTVTISE
ncbi:MAG: Dipeptide-binding ABC transporter, periplasmic substrate-binding component [uncultured Nocardioidaceae bacterium]|uniref:Dipeptide-binding ABC transporter, periplasmic substrate-binding component n=1 Tax=uncultured Nocardioidaceae bacterium TaxID=253824 RepID=A0A6J4N3V5_9ACTN|nr:MAG: Dipeptide-binding ABC transporter, periplasmic substrate-binding component [uncultured Nocardioidaceae bacterium]